jgi:trigger factor
VNKVLENISEKEEVQLPEAFLVKWLMFSNQNIASEEQAKEILEAEKAIIKNQIIEGKLLSDNDVKIDYADVLLRQKFW